MSANDYYRGYIDGMRCGGQRKLQYGGGSQEVDALNQIEKAVTQIEKAIESGNTNQLGDVEESLGEMTSILTQLANSRNPEVVNKAKELYTRIQNLYNAGKTMRTGGGWGRRMQEGGQGGDPMAELQQIAQTLQQIGQAMQNGQLDEQMMQALQQIGQALQQYAQSGDPQVAQTAQQILQELYQPIIEAIQQAQQQAQQQQQAPQGQPMRKGGSTRKANHNFFAR